MDLGKIIANVFVAGVSTGVPTVLIFGVLLLMDDISGKGLDGSDQAAKAGFYLITPVLFGVVGMIVQFILMAVYRSNRGKSYQLILFVAVTIFLSVVTALMWYVLLKVPKLNEFKLFWILLAVSSSYFLVSQTIFVLFERFWFNSQPS
ncbi:hypothetical protein [Parvicella tangerina]|uniref:Uncharacterized protein n=1 Tax=Parvicella tangerina TaxID=2829795 RepID=A0A916JKL6_9FLAO|nr:hypothetical protein [Parvicella tangerina]CAG5078439.1 hypothetical protein CRYO30217_00671 [Parvicella tangerina]